MSAQILNILSFTQRTRACYDWHDVFTLTSSVRMTISLRVSLLFMRFEDHVHVVHVYEAVVEIY